MGNVADDTVVMASISALGTACLNFVSDLHLVKDGTHNECYRWMMKPFFLAKMLSKSHSVCNALYEKNMSKECVCCGLYFKPWSIN